MTVEGTNGAGRELGRQVRAAHESGRHIARDDIAKQEQRQQPAPDHTAAERVVRDVLASGPPQVRNTGAERQAVVSRCRAIIRQRAGLPPP